MDTDWVKKYNKYYDERIAAAKMDAELEKFGRKTSSGGTVWTTGDLMNFFNRDEAAKKRFKKVARAARRKK